MNDLGAGDLGARLFPTQPHGLASYLEAGGGDGLRRALEIGGDAVLDDIEAAGLRGRGGAGFPTAMKWRTIGDSQCTTRYVVVNAAEGEPATYKDRWLLRRHPHLVLEGMAVAASVVGATTCFVAVKERFSREIACVTQAIEDLRERDLLGGVDVAVVLGPDEYLFGEETAMLEVIEDRGALPRLLPPYQVGLFARPGSPNPTVVNNVETFAHVALIARDGGARFRELGTPTSRGTMVCTLAGDVVRPGVHEIPLGITLHQLVHDIGGGPLPGREIIAVFPGASAGVIPAAGLDVVLGFDEMREAGSGLGSGGFVVYDDTACLVRATQVVAEFLGAGSCSQCPACKQGTLTMAERLARLEDGTGERDDIDTLASRVRSVTGGSRCGLPNGAAAVIGSVLEHFEDLLESHLDGACSNPRPLEVPMRLIDEERGIFAVEPEPADHDGSAHREVVGVR